MKNMWWFIYWRMQLWCLLFMAISGGIIGSFGVITNSLFFCDLCRLLTPIMLMPSLYLAICSWNKYKQKQEEPYYGNEREDKK
jgi:hypothetical protein